MTLAAPQRESAALDPRDRVEVLCDPGSFAPLRSGVLSSLKTLLETGERLTTPGSLRYAQAA